MKVSIAISAHNEGDLLLKTVKSCLETTKDLDCEVVVADDFSNDGSIKSLEKEYPDIQVLHLSERSGCAVAKDLAVRSSKGDVVVILDAHCKPEKGAISRLVEDVQEWHGEILVAPRIVTLDTEKWISEAWLPRRMGVWLDLEWFQGGWLKRKEMQQVFTSEGRMFYEQPCMAGCCMAISRSLYERLRGFDTRMLSWGMEDLDLALKCWLMGHSMLIDPEAVIGHRFRTRPADYAVPFTHFLMNKMRMARKNFDDIAFQDWCWRHRRVYDLRIWAQAWTLFEKYRESVEEERSYLARLRPHSVHQYAIQFGLAWPLTLSNSPYAQQVLLKRPRFTGPSETNPEESLWSHEPPCDDEDGDYGAKPKTPSKPERQKPRRGKQTGR